jgi:hypothetical protein
LRREFHFLALANHDVGGAASEAEAEALHDFTEDGANDGARAGADGAADDVTLEVMLFLHNLTFSDLDVASLFAVGLASGRLERDDAHLDGDEAAVNFHGMKSDVDVGLAAEHGEAAGFLDGANDTVDARARGNQHLGAEHNGIGDSGDEGVTIFREAGVDAVQKGEVDLGALQNLARIGFGHRRGGSGQQCKCQYERQD